MSFVLDQLKLLGLNGREVRVFTTLSTFGCMNMTLLAGRAGLPRTTVDAIVRRMVTQGLIERVTIGGHFEYLIDFEVVTDRLQQLTRKISPSTPAVPSEEDVHKPAEVFHARTKGVQARIDHVLASASAIHAGERVQVFVGVDGGGVTGQLARLRNYLTFARPTLLQVTYTVPRQLARHMREVESPIEVPIGSILNIVPNTHGRLNADLVMFSDLVLLIDLANGAIESLRARRAVDAMRHLLDISAEVGWSVDFATWLEGKSVVRE